MSKEIDVIIFKDKPYFEWKKLGYALVPKDNVRAAIEVNTWYGSAFLHMVIIAVWLKT
jgi:hypothetical protein